MSDQGRFVILGRNHGCLVASQVQPFQVQNGFKSLQPSTGLIGNVQHRTMQWLGEALNELFECSRCLIATVPEDERLASEQLLIGEAPRGRAAESTVASIAHRLSAEKADILTVKANDPLALGTIGRASVHFPYAIIGRMFAGSCQFVFVAGWRSSLFSQEEIRGLSRATRFFGMSAKNLMPAARDSSDLQKLLGYLVFPAFIVDDSLRLLETNRVGKRLLLQGGILHMEGGFLSGATKSATLDLRHAVSNALMPSVDQRWTNATIVLSSGYQRYAFAWVGLAPVHQEAGRVLVIVPRIDEALGARRIAGTFSLSHVEERIIARILRGRSPKDIGAELGLTEATVRTYTKRIMLKLNIKRQSELFLLYILTLSPFGSGRPEKALSGALPCADLNGRSL